ncbi:MAG TPA: phenylacetate--CoA ligase [bacterium]|nr:phenylacetate--CoA ligase [bacterium]HQL62817.1 phenylacetate--CoA ligase [bacterium]
MIWNKEMECLPREERRALQLYRLRRTLRRVYETIPAYRRRFDETGVTPDDLHHLEDLQKFPFTSKNDLRDNYPFGLFGSPLKDVVRIHSSSGTTGKPVVVGYTREDVDIWAESVARAIFCSGGGPDDIIQVAYGYGLFTGGLGLHYGGEKVGATVVPISGGNTKRQVMLFEDFGVTILACTPSYALCIAEMMEEMKVDHSKLKLGAAILGAEPWSNSMRNEIEQRMGVKAYDIYGLSEIIGPGVGCECECQDGLHICDDHFIPEIVDPDTGEVLPEGEKGELVFTCVTKQAFPTIRFRTHDISRLTSEPCRCGRTTMRMERISGRTDDMLIIRGVNVFPSQIESVLMQIEETEPYYLIVVDKRGTLDELEIRVEVREQIFSDEVRKLEELQRKIRREIESVLGISAVIRLVEPKTIERSIGKATRVVDRRTLENGPETGGKAS